MSDPAPRRIHSRFRDCARCRCLPLPVRALLPLVFALTVWSCTLTLGLFLGNTIYDQRLSEKPFKDSGFKWSFNWKDAMGPANPQLSVCAAGSPLSLFDMSLAPIDADNTSSLAISPLVGLAREFAWRKQRVDFDDDELDHIALLANNGVAFATNTRDVYPFPFELNNYFAAAHFGVLLIFVVFQGRRAPVVLKRLLLLLAASQFLFHVQLTVTQFPDPLLPCLPTPDLSDLSHTKSVTHVTLLVSPVNGSGTIVTTTIHAGNETASSTSTSTSRPLLGGIEDTKDGYTWRLDGPRQWIYNNQASQYLLGALFVQFYCTSWVVRIISWVVSVGGIFVIVPTHYHYTVDVMTGVIGALSVFLMYHWSVRTTLSIEKRWWVRWLEYDHICLHRYGKIFLCGVDTDAGDQQDGLLRGDNDSLNANRYSAPVTPGEARILGGSSTGAKQQRGSSGNESMTALASSPPSGAPRLPHREQRDDDVDSNHGNQNDSNSMSSNDMVAEAVVEAGAVTHHKQTKAARSSHLEATTHNNPASSTGSKNGSRKASRLSNHSKNGARSGENPSSGDGGGNAADFAPPTSTVGKIQRAAIIQHEENQKNILQNRPSALGTVTPVHASDLYAQTTSVTVPSPYVGPSSTGYRDEAGFLVQSYEMPSSDYSLEHLRVPTLTLIDKARFLTLILDEVEYEFYSVFSPHVPAKDRPQPTSPVYGATTKDEEGKGGVPPSSPSSNAVLGSRQSEGYFSCASGGNGGGAPSVDGVGASSNTSSKGGESRASSARSMPEEDSDEDVSYFRERNTSGGPVAHVRGTAADRAKSNNSSPVYPPLTTFTAAEGKETIRIRTESVRHSTLAEGITPVSAGVLEDDEEQDEILTKLAIRRWIIILIFFVVCGGSGGATAFINIISIDVADKNRPIGIPLPPDVIFHFLPSVPPHTPDFLLYSQVGAAFTFIGLSRLRFVIFRRIALIYGICMAGRCFTVPATFPIDPSILCKAREHPEGTTCGDLVYSGHTIAFICSLAVVLKYVRPLWVRAGVCAYTFCGLLAVVTSRLHYTRDVVTAVLVTGTVYYLCHRMLFHRYDLFLRYRFLRYLELDYFSILVEDRALAQQGKTRRYLWIKGSVGETFGAIADAWERRKRRQERERRRREGEV